jgi:hypothetical protein
MEGKKPNIWVLNMDLWEKTKSKVNMWVPKMVYTKKECGTHK